MANTPSRFWTAPLLALSLATPMAAQTLFGLDNGAAGAPAQPRLHHFDTTCQRISACFPGFAPALIPSPNGGVALGECSSSIWATDGVLLLNVDQNCNPLFACRTGAIPGSGNEWKGLAVDEDQNRLVYTDGRLIVELPLPTSCPLPSPVARCQVSSPPFSILTGVEIDPFDDAFWVCDVRGNVGQVAFSPTGVCTVNVIFQAKCPSGLAPVLPLQGITIDRCARTPFGTVGIVTVTDDAGNIIRMDLGGNPISCCPFGPALGAGGRLVGLARNPIQARQFGRSCSGPGCPPCLPVAGVRGESVIPTNCLDITLAAAPGQSLAFLLIDVTTVTVPFACGALYVPGAAILGPFPTGGTAGACDGGASFNLPIPLAPSLCGLPLFFQWGIVCTPAGGLSLSDAVGVTLN
ncbi:MAG: hypothetical protein AAF628_11765 [Planctomycetota bacterium]